MGLIVLFADTSTWSKTLRDLVSTEQVAVNPYTLDLRYNYWNYRMFVNACSFTFFWNGPDNKQMIS